MNDIFSVFKRRLSARLLLAFACLAGLSAFGAQPEPLDWNALTEDVASPRHLLVKIDPDRAFAPSGGGPHQVVSHQVLNATVARQFRLVPWQVVALPAGVDLAEAAALYMQDPAVLDVEPNYVLHLHQTIPNDPDFFQLWGMQRIEAPLAWDVTTGNSDIIVGVIDTGIRYTHEDLAGNMWVNPNPTVGDVHGASWRSGDGTMTSPDPMDTHGHGTHVAGTIGAVGNNALGVAGVTWQVRLMALKFLDPSGWLADAIAALEYAIEHGAHLTNNSWGGGGYSQALEDMIAAAGAANQLFVAAAGNSSSDNDLFPAYPASYPLDNIISVASLDPNGGRSGFSNYGLESVHIGAPGASIYSAWVGSDDDYNTISGTSMASPHVAGAAALLLGLVPDAPYAEIRNGILEAAVPNADLEGRTTTGGELNVANAVLQFAGAVILDREAYRSDAAVEITVIDAMVPDTENTVTVSWNVVDENGLPRVPPTNLNLDRLDGVRFRDALQLISGVTAVHGDTLSVSYLNTEGQLSVATAYIDDIPPVIMNLRAENVEDDRFEIHWDTDEPAIGGAAIVDPDDVLGPPLQSALTGAAFETNHVVVFTGLEPFTRYLVSVWAADPAGNVTLWPADPVDEEAYSPDPDDYLGVGTLGRRTVYANDFERDASGWTATVEYGEECWQHGLPSVGPYPPSRCWGTVLDGGYPHSTHAILTSPPIRVGNRPNLHFTHWWAFQTVNHFGDFGMVEVEVDGVWHTVVRRIWGTSGWRTDTRLLPDFMGNQNIRVRFRFQSTEGAVKPAGWYIDNFAVSQLESDGVLLASVEIDDSPPGGDGDGFAEPGETVDLTLTIFNLTAGPIEDAVGALSILNEGPLADQVVLPDGSPALLEYGTLAAYDAATAGPVTAHLPASIEPGTVLAFLQTITDGNGRQFESRYEMTVERRGFISGIVIDEVDETPLPDMTVTLRYGSMTQTTQTAPDGTFVLNGLIEDRVHEVTVSADGYAPVSRKIRASASGVVFRMGGAWAVMSPGMRVMSVLQGQTVTSSVTIQNIGNHPLNYQLRVLNEEDEPRTDWLRLDPKSGKLQPGATEVVELFVDATFMRPDIYYATIELESNCGSGETRQTFVILNVLQRPLLVFDGLRIMTTNGRITAGVPTSVQVWLRNTNALSHAENLDGTVTAAVGATVNSNYTHWSYIPAGGRAGADDDLLLNFTLDPMPDGATADIEMDVVVPDTGATFPIAFSLTNAAYSIEGIVSCDIWPNDGVGPPNNVLVEGALVTVQDTDGNEVGRAFSNSNGYYRVQAQHAEWIWIAATPPDDQPRMVPQPGQLLELTGDLSLDFTFRQDGGNDPNPDSPPRLILDRLEVDDTIYGNENGRIDPGERLVVRAFMRNIGARSATSVTGMFATTPMGIPDIMTVAQGSASNPKSIIGNTNPLHPVLLEPVFEIEVDPDAERGSYQRFRLTVTDSGTHSNPPRSWLFDVTLRVDARITLAGSAAFFDGANTPANFQRTRVRYTQQEFDRTTGVANDGTFRFFDVPRNAIGTLSVVAVPEGYALPAPLAVPRLSDDTTLAPITIFSSDFFDVSPDPLAFTLTEGHSATGQLTVANNGAAAVTINASRLYRRDIDEVRKPEFEPFAIGETRVMPVDWDALDPDAHQPDELVVRFAEGVPRAEQREILAQQGLEPVFYFNSFPAALARRTRGPADLGTLALLANSLEEDHRVKLVAPEARAERFAATMPDDPFFEQLYGLFNARQTGGSLGADIRAPWAWNVTTGSKDIIVAVCDTGVMIDHEDLAANIWRNPYPGTFDNTDPDPQIVDDFHGWNFFHWNNDVDDEHGHGTHVAGTIGAIGDNSIGVVGVNWNVTIMPIRLTNMGGSFTTSARIAKSIEYAAEMGAHISNHSWGGPDTAGLIGDAIAFAATRNHLVVAAAGNSAQDLEQIKAYPAYYGHARPNVITVAASDHHGELAPFTTFGAETVHLAAPGVNILSTIPDECFMKMVRVWPQDDRYGLSSGTSMAAPHVAGAAALLWSMAPEADFSVIKAALLDGARHDPNLEGWVETSGHLDVWRALQAMGADWLQIDAESFTLAPGASTNVTVVVNDPPALVSRWLPYEGWVVFSEASGAFTRSVPVSVTVNEGPWLKPDGLRIENLEDYDDDLPPSPGDSVELWVSVKNRGMRTVEVDGLLSGGGGSTIHVGAANWGDIDDRDTVEAMTPFSVTLDPNASGDVVFDLELFADGQSAGVFPLTVPILPGYAVSGQIVSASGAVPGAYVEVWGEHGERGQTDADGRFLLRGLPDGNYRLRAIPDAYERSGETPFSMAGADLDLGDILVRARTVALIPQEVEETLQQGATSTRTLRIENVAGGGAAGNFEFDLYVAPPRRVALVSDGLTLEPLVAPLTAMGFDVSRYTNNFDRVQHFWPQYNYHQLIQEVRYTHDPYFLAAFDAVVFDMTGPNGEGRLLSDAEVGAFANYTDQGGKVVFTGANPLSLPDNHGLIRLAGIESPDRAESAAEQAEAVREVLGNPFVTLDAGELVKTTSRILDLAPFDDVLPQGVLLRVDDANKLLRRERLAGGAIYIWTGNPDDVDWEEPGVRQDVLRGILWRELIADAASDVPWLAASSTSGSVPVGSAYDIDLTLNAGYPSQVGRHSAILTIVGRTSGTDVRALRVDLDVVPATLRAFTKGQVTDWRGEPLKGDGGPGSSLFQLVWAGDDGVISPPDPDGSPGGDDELLAVYVTGLPHGRFGVGFEAFPDSGRFEQVFRHHVPQNAPNKHVYVRAWDGPAFESSLVYGESSLYTLQHLANEAHDFGSWTVGTVLRYGRDSNGDTLPDGWLIENRPDIDPRAPVEPLESVGEYSGKLGIPLTATAQARPHQVVVADNVVFVLDESANSRIAIVDRATHAITGYYGSNGTGIGQFKRPRSLAIDPRTGVNRIVVADTENHRLKILTFNPGDGTILSAQAVGQRGAGVPASGGVPQFEFPAGVALRSNGQIYVADTKNHRVQILNETGGFVREIVGFGTYEMLNPQGLAVDRDLGVFVADTGRNRVLRFSHTGTLLGAFGAKGSGDGQFEEPVDIRVWRHTWPGDAELPTFTVRRLVVTDRLNDRVQIFRYMPDGSYPHLLNVGGSGNANGELHVPYGAFPIEDGNRLYVADTGNQRIQWFDVTIDADGDGMCDLWEDVHGLDSTRDDAHEDPDNDGLSNIGEFRARTHPRDPDSSGNGVGDLWEVYRDGFPGGPAILQSLVASTNLVTAGESVLLTATFDRELPADAEVWLTLTGASPRTARRMQTANGTVFIYSHATQLGQEGWTDGSVFCGYVDPPTHEETLLFEVEEGAAPLPDLEPFPITSLRLVPPPPEITWLAVEGATYRIERSFDLTADPVVWTLVEDNIVAPADGPMTRDILTPHADDPPTYFRVIGER